MDERRTGTHYRDRLTHIMSALAACGLASHEETVRLNDHEVRRVETTDIEPSGEVILTRQYEGYGLRVSPRVLRRVLAAERELASALNVERVRVEADGDLVRVYAPRPDAGGEQTITYAQAAALHAMGPEDLLLGVDETGQQLVLHLNETAPHCAVIGQTGSGKTSLLRAMMLSALQARMPVALFDTSGGLRSISGHPQVWRGGLLAEAETCVTGLNALAGSIGRRHYGRLYVVVDELPDLLAQRPEARAPLERIAQAGRHAGLHLIMGAQHPLATDVGSVLMRNMTVRIVGRVADRIAAYNAAGRRGSDAENLPGRGEMVIVSTSGELTRFRAAYPTSGELAAWAMNYPPKPARPFAEVAAAPSAPQGGGRALADVAPEVVEAIRQHQQTTGKAPSSNWVYAWTRERFGQGYNRHRAARALAAAGAHG